MDKMGNITKTDKELGQKLREIRTNHQLSVRAVVDKSGGRFKPSILSAYERGERAMTVSRFVQLCEVYGVAASEVLEEVITAPEHHFCSECGHQVI